MGPDARPSRWTPWLIAALVVGTTLRLIGLGYGLPHVYNPDEVAIMNRAMGLAQNRLNPHNFLYPTLYFYALFVWEGAWFVIGLSPKGRYQLDKFKLSLPVVGDLLTKISLSRFCHTFSLSLRSGVNVFNALGIASEVTGNSFIESSVSKARDYVNVGEKISTSMELSGKDSGCRFPDIVIRMINVGEQSGSLAETLDKVNQFYDKEVPSTVKKMFSLMEPLMILMMGLVVGGIALSVFLPLTKLITAVGGD